LKIKDVTNVTAGDFDGPAAICRISKSSTNNLVWFAREQYRRRGRIVEFCHAWIKSKLGLR
jgi:hypothetical protein